MWDILGELQLSYVVLLMYRKDNYVTCSLKYAYIYP